MIARIGPVYDVAYTGSIANANAFRSPLIPSINTNALSVDATSLNLPGAVGTTIAQGEFLNAATATEPVCVLGAAAAQRLGIDRIFPGERIWVAGMWFYLAGILRPAILAPEIDDSRADRLPRRQHLPRLHQRLDGHPAVGNPTEIYLRAQTDQVQRRLQRPRRHRQPREPQRGHVSQPSDALVAEADAKGAFNGLFLGLGAVALLVGAIGVANIMIISVLERRSEIGLRRALGATRGQIRDPVPQPKRSSSPCSAAPPASAPARSPPPSTPTPNTGPPSSPPSPGAAASPPPSSSAPSPASSPPSAPPASPPPTHSEPHDHDTNAHQMPRLEQQSSSPAAHDGRPA